MAATAASSASGQPGSAGVGSTSGRPGRAVSTTKRHSAACPSDMTVGRRARHGPSASSAAIVRCAPAARSRLAWPASVRATLTMSRSPLRVRTTKPEIPPPPCEARSIDQPSAGADNEPIAAGTTDLASESAE